MVFICWASKSDATPDFIYLVAAVVGAAAWWAFIYIRALVEAPLVLAKRYRDEDRAREERLHKEVETLREKGEQANKIIEYLNRRVKSLESEHEQGKKDQEILRAQLRNAEATSSRLHGESVKLKEEIDRLKAALEKRRTQEEMDLAALLGSINKLSERGGDIVRKIPNTAYGIIDATREASLWFQEVHNVLGPDYSQILSDPHPAQGHVCQALLCQDFQDLKIKMTEWLRQLSEIKEQVHKDWNAVKGGLVP